MRRARERSLIRSAKVVFMLSTSKLLLMVGGIRSFVGGTGTADTVNDKELTSVSAFGCLGVRTLLGNGEGEGVCKPVSFRFFVRGAVPGSEGRLTFSTFPFKGIGEAGGVRIVGFPSYSAKALRSAVNNTECAHPAYDPQICCSLEDTSACSFGVMGGTDLPE